MPISLGGLAPFSAAWSKFVMSSRPSRLDPVLQQHNPALLLLDLRGTRGSRSSRAGAAGMAQRLDHRFWHAALGAVARRRTGRDLCGGGFRFGTPGFPGAGRPGARSSARFGRQPRPARGSRARSGSCEQRRVRTGPGGSRYEAPRPAFSAALSALWVDGNADAQRGRRSGRRRDGHASRHVLTSPPGRELSVASRLALSAGDIRS